MSCPDATDLQTVLPLICLAVILRNEPADLEKKKKLWWKVIGTSSLHKVISPDDLIFFFLICSHLKFASIIPVPQ